MQLSFNTANNQATNAGIQYDAAGNLINDSTHSYTYDADGNLLAVDNGATAVYVYDALDHRVEKTSGGAGKEYVHFPGSAVAESNPSTGAWTDMICGNGEVIAEVAGAQTAMPQYRLGDHLGSLAVETNGSGIVTGTNVFLPFGDLLSSTTTDSFQFTDLPRDAENGTDHAGHLLSPRSRFASSPPEISSVPS